MTASSEPGAIVRLGRDSALYAIGGALARAVNLLLLPVYTAVISPREFGVLATLLLVAAVLTPIATLGVGVSTGIAYFDRHKEAERTCVIWTSSTLTLATGSVLAIVALTAADGISEILFSTPEYAYPAALALLSAAVGAFSQPLVLGIQFRRQVRRYVWISAATALLGGVLGLTLVGLLGRGMQGVLEAQFASQLALAGMAARETWKIDAPRFDGPIVRTLLRLGLPLVPSFYFLLVLQQGNQFVLKELRGLEALGVYIVGYNLGLMMSLIVSGFTTAWTPFFLSFSREPAAGVERLGRAMTYYVIAVGTLTLLFFAWSRPLVNLLAADPYQDAYIVVGYSAAAYFLVGVFSLLLPPLYYARQVWAVTLIQGIGAVAALGLQIALVGRFGVLGAAIGLAGGFLVLCIALTAWSWFQRAHYVRIPYDWQRLATFGGFIALGGMVVTIPPSGSPMMSLIGSIVGTIVVLAAAWMALRSDERRALAVGVRQAIAGQRT